MIKNKGWLLCHVMPTFKNIPKTQLEIGGLYLDRKENKSIFLGYVDTIKYSINKNQNNNFDYIQNPYNNVLLFYNISTNAKLKEIDNFISTDNLTYYKVVKTHNYIQKINKLNINNSVIKCIRDRALKEIQEKILSYSENKNNKMFVRALEKYVEFYSEWLNLYQHKEPKKEPFDIKKYLLFT